MKDFDEARRARREAALQAERGFTIGGESFLRRVEVKPESLAALDRFKAAKRDEQGRVIDAGSTVSDDIGVIDEVILALIEPEDGAHDRYHAIRARDHDVLTLEDLRTLMEWLLEEHTGRPTVPPSPSTPPPAMAGTSSTDESPLQAATSEPSTSDAS